ncbi:MAG: protein-L-isoaspartate(D-aspartate) O-methyltransferase [Alphaproteobacteria bacterium]|nr:protein-L-isoaspartate(D-aspartate) O-methyltransferase [Alphaproteobacteria bacterium]MCB9974571.1 protein-L-isoaspartate(D-aspartate) O-methyltransferase [Rhodospirillales bacterium]
MNTQAANKRIRLIMHLRQRGITDTGVLSAMERVPREAFVPAHLTDQAWEDMALPIGLGQTISQPLVVATMSQALELSDRDKVLEIGTGCGYQTAILAYLSRRVYTIERHKALLEEAEERLHSLKVRNFTALAADGMMGWPVINGIHQAPFDKIIVTAAARDKPPSALYNQLKVGGVMVIPVGEPGEQMLRRYKKETEDSTVIRDIMPVRFVPLLPHVTDSANDMKAVV